LKYFSEYFPGYVRLVESLAEVLRPGAEGCVDIAPLLEGFEAAEVSAAALAGHEGHLHLPRSGVDHLAFDLDFSDLQWLYWRFIVCASRCLTGGGQGAVAKKTADSSAALRNDKQKTGNRYSNGKSWLGKGLHSHPCHDETVAWMGHPIFFVAA
jgi:hypothetical protein